MKFSASRWAHFFSMSLSFFLSWADAATNVTLDDTDSAITYSQTSYGTWYDPNCSYCSAKPNPVLCYGGTWREFSNLPTEWVKPIYFTVQFEGSAIYIYAIFWDPPTRNISDSVDYNFTHQIDEGDIKSFSRLHFSISQTQFIYNQNVVKYTGLADVWHNLTITLQPLSFFMLDYVIITKGSPDLTTGGVPTSSIVSDAAVPTNSGRNGQTNLAVLLGSAIGGAAGGIILTILVLWGIIHWRHISKRRKQLIQNSQTLASPFSHGADLIGPVDGHSHSKPIMLANFNPYEQSGSTTSTPAIRPWQSSTQTISRASPVFESIDTNDPVPPYKAARSS